MRMKFKLSFILILSVAQLFAQPNSDSSITRARIDKYYVNSYFKDYKAIVTCPFRPSIQTYTAMSVYAGTMYLLISHYDEKIQRFSQENRTTVTDKLAKYVFEPTGRGIYPAAIVGLIYTHGLIYKNQKSKKVAMNCAKSFIIANTFAQIAKYSFTRQRPFVESNANNWFQGGDNHSFFSGHTTTAFSIMTVLAEEYKKTVWVPILSYSLATCVGLSRINDNKHWASDVLTGALCGYLTGRLVVRKNNWGINIVPKIIIAP